MKNTLRNIGETNITLYTVSIFSNVARKATLASPTGGIVYQLFRHKTLMDFSKAFCFLANTSSGFMFVHKLSNYTNVYDNKFTLEHKVRTKNKHTIDYYIEGCK